MKLNESGKSAYLTIGIDVIIEAAKSRNLEVSEKQAKSILENIVNTFCITIGINLDVIDNFTDSYLESL